MTRDECRAKCIETVAKTLYESDRDGPCSLALGKLCLSIGEMASGPRPLQRVSFRQQVTYRQTEVVQRPFKSAIERLQSRLLRSRRSRI